jgi:hypothetical protein
MAPRRNLADRNAELEDELKQRDRRISELKADIDRERELVADMREHVEDAKALIDRWIEAFDMSLDDDGKFGWSEFVKSAESWFEKYQALLKQWNRFVPDYNAVVRPRRPPGRPLEASEAQVKDVLKRRKAGESLRAIADAMSLTLNTVRTIIARKDGVDRTSLRRLERIDPDRSLIAQWRARKRVRDELPRSMNTLLAQGRELLKEAKR